MKQADKFEKLVVKFLANFEAFENKRLAARKAAISIKKFQDRNSEHVFESHIIFKDGSRVWTDRVNRVLEKVLKNESN